MSNPDTWPVRQRMLVEDGAAGASGGSVRRLLDRMRHSAFQGRKLGEAFETWTWMIDQGCLISMGLAGSMASAGLAPLLIWLVERGYVDVLVSTSANATEDLLEARGTPFYQVDPEKNVVRFRKTESDAWREYQPISVESARAKQYFDTLK